MSLKHTRHKFKISYKSNHKTAIELITNILNGESFVLKNPAPSILINSLSENGVELIVKAWSPSSKMFGVKITLLNKILESFNKNKIKIAPQRIEIAK